MALEVKPLEGANTYRQSKHIQFNSLPMRAAMLGNTGQGKTAASFVIWRELFPLCNRWHIIASTIETDGSFSKMKEMVTKGLRDKGVDPDDPGEILSIRTWTLWVPSSSRPPCIRNEPRRPTRRFSP